MSAADFRLRKVPRSIAFFLGEDRRAYLLHLSIFLAGQSYELLPPLLIGLMVNFLLDYRSGQSLWPLAGIILFLAVSSAINAVLRLRSRRRLGQYVVNARSRARMWGFARLLDQSLAWHQREGTGNKAQRVLTGSDAVGEWVGVHNDLVPPLVAFAGIAIACAILHPLTILFFVAFVAGLLLIELHFDRKVAALSQRVNAANEQSSGTFVEVTANVLAVKALGAAAGMNAQLATREAASRNLAHERVRLRTSKWMWFQVHSSIALALFLAGVSAAVLQGALSVGMVLTYTQYFAGLRSATTTLADRFQVLAERFVDLSRLMPLFDDTHCFVDGNRDFPADWQSLSLQQVSYRHDSAREDSGLVDASFSIRRGEHVGVAGRSGSGKSTLLRLLLGLHRPQAGKILVDALDSLDIRHASLTEQVAVVLQETELFNLSLRDNVCVMREVPGAVFDAACHVACLDELIARLPQGLDTPLGERGYALSGGERQRIGIARALCRPFSLLLLDEATSALDVETEAQVLQRLRAHLAKDVTIISVAHRPAALAQLDRVLVFEAGRVVEREG
ncbi:ABC transporter ATP-binding protein [Uliginosibacterium sediminicola]|uniref:ABC transporter ATP-binding protein n=1 Tax=Uliginosibacterium sediminicola TaxID=2024550 RepID=A0ABU9Z3C6_9RHOO